MALFNRKSPPPDWSPFADAKDWREFERIVSAQRDARRWTGNVREGRLNDGPNQIGLGNVAQMCASMPRGEWPGVIHEHFEVAGSIKTPGEEFDNRGEARLALRARLLDDEFLAQLEHQPAARRVSEDLHLVLAFDLPDRVMVVPREDVLEWGPEDELFDLALEQTRAEPGIELERIEVTGGEQVLALNGDSFFTATHVLWANELDPPESEHGTLVAVPNRHLVFAYPIRDAAVVGVINDMITLAVDWEAKGPGSLSRHLYWLHDGELERLPVVTGADSTNFFPSDAFVEVLNELAADA